MGWGRMLLLGNVGQQMDIEEVKDYLNQAIREINQNAQVDEQQADAIARLDKENRELKLCVLGLARLLSSKGVLSESELSSLGMAIEANTQGPAHS